MVDDTITSSVSDSIFRELLAALDLANDSIILRTMEDHICYWNQGAERLYGWTKREVYGRESHELFDTKFPEPLSVIRQKLVEHGKWEGLLNHVRKDGTRIIVASRWTLYRDVTGTPTKYVEINRVTNVGAFPPTSPQKADDLGKVLPRGPIRGQRLADALLGHQYCRSCHRAGNSHLYVNCEQRIEARLRGEPTVPEPLYPDTWWNRLRRRKVR